MRGRVIKRVWKFPGILVYCCEQLCSKSVRDNGPAQRQGCPRGAIPREHRDVSLGLIAHGLERGAGKGTETRHQCKNGVYLRKKEGY